ncbi:DOPA 4,5-dioxygenase family protein [Nitrosomonas sp. Is24]|uniref:DOPA 4,5-dioxygenase family protein n=1 Tax=Nitrosomonas sp. Is24 TaxID=3080533 RepID=UPI00294A9AA9|nr:DOPA 4,5-dioxygenase family protein [Nitrosomonas sp. Is24]MDV6341005.1 DOPA 4,5-dioxygenase family protein [Nitrosomonas sp. Is24]
MQTFHGHIYFLENEIDRAAIVRENIAQALPQLTYVGRLIAKPIGPHSRPMFEIHIPASEIEKITPVLDEMRQGLSVLIHPVQENELEAHTVDAKWLGEELPLDLRVLTKN